MSLLASNKSFFNGALTTIEDEINSMLRTPFFKTEASTLEVPVDIHETEDGYTLSFDLPGMERKDVSVEVKEGVVTVSGERKRDESKKGNGYTYHERHFGSFSRSFHLPAQVSTSEVSAKLKDGILEVRLLKTPESKPLKILIE